MTTASPAFTFTGASGSLQKKAATAGGSVVATLDDIAGVSLVQWSIASTDETSAPGDFSLALSGAKNSICTITGAGLAAGKAALLQCTINSGVDPQTGDRSERMSARAKFHVPTAAGLEVACFDEEDESSANFWWTGLINALIRYASSSVASLAVTAPIVNTGTASAPNIGISPATALAAGSQSTAHFAMLADATASLVASKLLLRGATGQLVGKWFETDSGTGARAGAGDVRCAANGVGIAFRNAANGDDINAISCDGSDNVIIGAATASGCRLECATGGAHILKENSLEILRIHANSGPEIRFNDTEIGGAPKISVSPDVTLEIRSGVTAKVKVNSTGVGFYGQAPVGRLSILQTYTDTSAEIVEYTPDDESAAYTGMDNAQLGSVYAAAADVNALRVAVENLRALTENTTQVLNSIINHFKSRGDLTG